MVGSMYLLVAKEFKRINKTPQGITDDVSFLNVEAIGQFPQKCLQHKVNAVKHLAVIEDYRHLNEIQEKWIWRVAASISDSLNTVQ